MSKRQVLITTKQAETLKRQYPGKTLDEAASQMILEKLMKTDNAVRKRYYIKAKLRKTDQKKLRKWLDDKHLIDIATDNGGHVVLVNTTRMYLRDLRAKQ